MIRLPKTLPERAGEMDRAHVLERIEGRGERLLRDALDLEVDLDERRVAVDVSNGGKRPDPAAKGGRGLDDGLGRFGAVDDIEADGGRLGRATTGHDGVGSASRASRDRPRRAGGH